MTDDAGRPDQTGSGAPRSASADATREADQADVPDEVVVGATADDPGESETGGANRSGSGGSGGNAEDPSEEGSTGQTTREMLEG